ncbi:MAG: amino acid ABC transporter permease [Pseudolysinimonas sp.]
MSVLDEQPVLGSGPAMDEKHLVYVKPRRFGVWISGAVLAIVIGQALFTVVRAPALDWPTVGKYILDPRILAGVGNTLILTVAAITIAIVIGVLLAVMRNSANPVFRIASALYVAMFRSIPLLVLILLVYFLAILVPRIGLGLPFLDPWVSVDTNDVISPMSAAILALGLGQAAYTCEIIRGGIFAVDRGQREAAMTLGMRPAMVFFRIVMPQAMRVVVPGLGNEAIGMLKATSLVQVIGFTELLTTAQRIYGQNYETIPLLAVVTIWYAVLTTIGTVGQTQLEKKFGKGFA